MTIRSMIIIIGANIGLAGCIVQPLAKPCATGGLGCGPAILGPIAPIVANCFIVECRGLPTLVCFTCDCNEHDTCYVTCGADKEDCDLAFLDAMLATCKETFGDNCGEGSCQDRAFLYAALVIVGGGPSFASGQQAACEVDGETKGSFLPASLSYTSLPFELPYLDADADLLPDDWEILVGLDPTNPLDATLDDDGDGLWNIAEYVFSMDPFEIDSDADGVDDLTQVERLSF